MKMKYLLTVIFFIVGFSFCSNDKTEEEKNNSFKSDKNACDLLKISDIEKVLDQKFEMGISHSKYDCGFKSVATNENGISKISLSVQITELQSNVNPKEALSKYIKNMKEGLGKDSTSYKTSTVEGIGDLAVWSQSQYSIGDVILLIFKKVSSNNKTGTIMISLHFFGSDKFNESEIDSVKNYALSLGKVAIKNI
jgi:hypothetical protein